MGYKQSLKYASYSTFYTWIAIFIFLYFFYQVELPHTLANPMYCIPLLSTFISGFFLFNRIKEPFLLGIIHYLFAHLLVLYLFSIYTFIENFAEHGLAKTNFTISVVEGFKVVFYSLAGLEVVLPFFIFGGYWCKKKIK